MVLGLAGGVTEGRKILWTTLCVIERGDTGRTGIPDGFQHAGGRSGKGGSAGSLRASGGTSQVWLGGR